MIQLIKQKFVALYGVQPTMVVRAPGRINLIGEHTDYNNGFVLPAAINKAIYIAISKRDDAEIHLYSMDFNASFEANINELLPIKSWPTYILGVADQFKKKGYAIGGFNLVMYGDVPIGAGLSSSAAVECSIAYALNELFLLSIEKIELVKMAQKAEHEFAGVNCGIMDQFASMFGQANQVVRLDCRSLEYEYFPFSMQEVSIVLLDTCVKHSLASSEYNTRRLQCEAGVAAIQTKYPAVNSLRDATIDMLNETVDASTEVYKKCLYVIQEIARVQEACKDLQQHQMDAFGQKMYATHQGLSKLYEVSCAELDFLVNAVKENPAVLGARMMGGGFGGCTINLVKKDAVEDLISKVSVQYEKAFHTSLKSYIVQIEDGVSPVI